jgi:ribose transport system substrate-binding protein
VATDNEVGGRLGGEKLAALLGGKGRIILLRYAEGSDSTTKREDGFLTAMRVNPGIEIVSSNQYAGADVEGAYKKGEAILSQHKRPDGSLNIDGIFCANESSTFGMLRVLQDNGWAGKVRFVGFDASDSLVKSLAAGHIDALVVQDPVRMGYLGVKTMVSHIKGEKVERRIDTGVRVVSKADMELPEVKELLKPDLDRWLRKQ